MTPTRRLRLDSLTPVLALVVAVSGCQATTPAQRALMTCMMRGRQYIVMPVGGANLPAELVALALP